MLYKYKWKLKAFRISDELWSELKIKAIKKRITTSELLRQIIESEVK